jgi:hypothetical protein
MRSSSLLSSRIVCISLFILTLIALQFLPRLGTASNSATATPVALATIPDAPQNLAAQSGNGQNFLGWQAPASNGGATITNYRVFRGTTSSNRQIVTSGGCANLGAVLACTDTGLTNGQSYNYIVSAVNSAGQGAPSNSATATPATATAPLSITTTALNPPTATVGVGYSAQQAIAATGGQTPYSWSASGLPNGMSINSSSGAVFGTPTATGTFNFTVTVHDSSSPQKTASKVLVISVAGATSTPIINSITPGIPQIGNSDQNVTISGSNFQAPLTVTVFFPGGSSTNLSSAQIQNITSTSFVMRTTFGSAGTWSIRVSNPDGSQSNTFNFTVQSTIQPPTIGSINPTTAVARDSDQDVAVYGSNFQQNLSVSVTFSDSGNTNLSSSGSTNLSSSLSSTLIIPITTITSSSFLITAGVIPRKLAALYLGSEPVRT